MKKMTLKKQLVSILATGAVLLNSTMPVFAGTTILLTGNGADTYNKADVEIENQQVVVQSNSANVNNDIDADADSGDNEANRNQGNVSITTGAATSDVTVTNTLNSNAAALDCCEVGDVDVEISDNLAGSENKVYLDVNHDRNDDPNVAIYQSNDADVDNDIDADADSGDNEANKNGGGDVEIKTSDATAKVNVATTANANSAVVGGSQGDESGISLKILRNGADSKNKIDLDFENNTELVQENAAEVDNDIDADADSGDNEANENGSGDVVIHTGEALADVSVDNLVNFNWADVDCGCLLDVLAKIADNSADSENKIEADLENGLEVYQDNCGQDQEWSWGDWHDDDCKVDNDVDADADSGDNESNENSDGGHGGDPAITTDDATAKVDVSTAGYSNVFGDAPEWEWPAHWGGLNLSLTLNLSDLLAALGLN